MVRRRVLRIIAETFVNLHAIEQTQFRGRRRVDGVGRLKFDFHTGSTRPVRSRRSASRPRRY